MVLLKNTWNPIYDTSDCSTNHLTFKERSFICFISQKVLKVLLLLCTVLI